MVLMYAEVTAVLTTSADHETPARLADLTAALERDPAVVEVPEIRRGSPGRLRIEFTFRPRPDDDDVQAAAQIADLAITAAGVSARVEFVIVNEID
jgi:hypothetical protein